MKVYTVTVKIRPFSKGDERIYVRIHNEGYSTEEWWGIAAKPVSMEDVIKMDYDATFFAEIKVRQFYPPKAIPLLETGRWW